MASSRLFVARGRAPWLVGAGLIAALGLGACGSSSNNASGSGSPTSSAPATTSAPATSAPTTGGTPTTGGAPTTAGTATSGAVRGTVNVFAAASLSGAFDEIGKGFEQAHPGVTVRFNYAGSSTLATQITQGAPADVFASANISNMTTVVNAHLTSSAPKIFAHNTLEIMVESGNPKNIMSVSDLTRSGIRLSLCEASVPCGAYAKEVFQKAGVALPRGPEETSVSNVVTRVRTGEADAGIVYATDVKAGGSHVAGVPIPAAHNVIADYPIAQLKDAPNPTGAAAFISYVAGPDGQKVLTSLGFKEANS